MKKVLVKLASFLLLFVFAYANDANLSEESVIEANLPKQKSIFLSYEEVPQKVYVGQVFPIKIKALIANKDFEDITSSFENYDIASLEILNPDAKWQWYSDNIFYNTYYIKVNTKEASFPELSFHLLFENRVIESETLHKAQTNIIELNKDKHFSSVIANSLEINKYKTTYYDDENYIIVIEMEADTSNLEDFSLQWVSRDGIDSKTTNLPFSKIFYYAIVPEHVKEFSFTYFNLLDDNFKKITLPILVDEDKVSTQIGLNPKESSLQIYRYALLSLISILFIYFYLKRGKIIYIVLLLFTLGIGIYEELPIHSIKIQENSKVRILPTENSTIFYTVDRPMYAEKLGNKNQYIKVLLPNEKIGWIKESDVISY